MVNIVNARSCSSSKELDKDKDQKLDYREFAALFQPPDWQPSVFRILGAGAVLFTCSGRVWHMTLRELTGSVI